MVNEQAVDPFLARLALERMQGRVREARIATCAALVAGVALGLLGNDVMASATLSGALAGAILTRVASSDRAHLVLRLARQRSAYDIDDVARAGARLATMRARDRLAAAIGELVLEADGFRPGDPRLGSFYERVRTVREDLLDVAFHLARPGSTVHPSTVVLIERLFDAPSLSPLFNEGLPVAELRAVLRRAQLGLQP